MPDANIVRSVTYLFDCFLDDYHDEKYLQTLSDLDMRAQMEVCKIFTFQSLLLSKKPKETDECQRCFRVASSFLVSGRWAER